MIELSFDDIQIVYILNSWDGIPYAGHAWYHGLYCYFVGGPDCDDERHPHKTTGWGLTLYAMDTEPEVLIRELARRKLFEDLVGTHKSKMLPDTRSLIKPHPQGLTFWNNPAWDFVRADADVSRMRCLGQAKTVFEDEAEDRT